MANNLYRFGPFDPATVNEPFTYDLTAWLGSEYTISGTPTADVAPLGPTVANVVFLGPMVTVYVNGPGAVQNTDYKLTLHVSAKDQSGNQRGPVAIGAMALCLSPVPAT